MDSMTSLNLFKFCSGLRVLGYLAILLVIAIVAISYCAVVVVTCGPQLARGGVGSVLYSSILVVFHFLLALLLWSYFMVVIRDPGSVTENWRSVLEENLELGISVALSDYVSSETGASTRTSSTGTERRQALGNAPTIEVNEKNRAARWKLDIGRRKNFEQVFGAKKAYWFFPCCQQRIWKIYLHLKA